MYMPDQASPQAALFYNRIKKRYKHLRKYAKRCGICAYRLYDKDIPEVPVAVDIYIEESTADIFAVLTEYERSQYKGRRRDKKRGQEAGLIREKKLIQEDAEFPQQKVHTPDSASTQELTDALCAALEIPPEHVYGKCRKRQRGEAQYEKITDSGKRIIVREGLCRFFINLSDYLDTGLFLDHRPTRFAVSEEAAGKTVLNLFCYTASFSIHALAGGARHVCSVDLSKNYLQWAHDNIRLNGMDDATRYRFVHSDVRTFLDQAAQRKEQWDIIICDPPTFSNSKRTPQFFDVNRHWLDLIRSCCDVLAPNGTLYFSTNSRTLKFDSAALSDQRAQPAETDAGYFMYHNEAFTVRNITEQSIPEDFRNKKIHRLWKITRSGGHKPRGIN